MPEPSLIPLGCPNNAKCQHSPSCPTAVYKQGQPSSVWQQLMKPEAWEAAWCCADTATPFPAQGDPGLPARLPHCALRLCSKDHPRTSAHSFLMGDKSLQRHSHGQILLIFQFCFVPNSFHCNMFAYMKTKLTKINFQDKDFKGCSIQEDRAVC